MSFAKTTPILRIFDEAKAKDFYVAFLGFKYARPGIQETPWGSREMAIHDPFGNRLVFTSAIST